MNSTELKPWSAELTLLCGTISFGCVYLLPKILGAPAPDEVAKWVSKIYKDPNPEVYANKLSVVAAAKQAAGVACGLLSLGVVGAVFVYRTNSVCLLSSAAVAGFWYIGQKLVPEGNVLAAATQWVRSRARAAVPVSRPEINTSIQALLYGVPNTSALLRRRQQNGLLINTSRASE